MKTTFLDFEQPIADLEAKIEALRFVQDDSAVDISEEIARLEIKSLALTKDLYAKLTPWQIALVARHPQRPYPQDHLVRSRSRVGGDYAIDNHLQRPGCKECSADCESTQNVRPTQWASMHPQIGSKSLQQAGQDTA